MFWGSYPYNVIFGMFKSCTTDIFLSMFTTIKYAYILFSEIMLVPRRVFARLLRLRNLLIFTVIVILLYILKMFGDIEGLESKAIKLVSHIGRISKQDSYFVPQSMRVSRI